MRSKLSITAEVSWVVWTPTSSALINYDAYTVQLHGAATTVTRDNWLGTLFGCDALNGNNYSKWCDKPYDALIKEAKGTADQGRRIELYKPTQQLLKDTVPITPIAYSTVYQPMRNNVTGFADKSALQCILAENKIYNAGTTGEGASLKSSTRIVVLIPRYNINTTLMCLTGNNSLLGKRRPPSLNRFGGFFCCPSYVSQCVQVLGRYIKRPFRVFMTQTRYTSRFNCEHPIAMRV